MTSSQDEAAYCWKPKETSVAVLERRAHYYRTDLCSRPFIPAAFGPGTIGGFCPGPTANRASGGTGAFCPVWRHQPGQKGGLLSRLVAPTGTKHLGPLIPFPLPPPELFSSLVLVVLGLGERSSCSFLHHICEDL